MVITNDYEKKYGDGEMVCSKAFTENHYTNQGFAHSIWNHWLQIKISALFIYLFSPEKWPFCEQPESHLAERINVDQFVLYMQVRTISTWVNLCQREGASLKPTTYQTNKYERICNNYLYGLVEMKVDYKVRDHGFNM